MQGCDSQNRPVQVEESVEVIGSPLSVSANETFVRTVMLTGEDAEPPTVSVNRVSSAAESTPSSSDAFHQLMGFENTTWQSDVSGAAKGSTVTISYTDDASESQIAEVLAHEFAHLTQPDGLQESLRARQGEYAATTDAALARESVVEGGAEFVSNTYAKRYLSPSETNVDRLANEWETQKSGTRFVQAPYYRGFEYVDDRIQSPCDLHEVYRSPPLTTEQVLHGSEDRERPPSELSVQFASNDSSWDPTVEDTKGELFVQLTLLDRLSASRAERAAEGWKNDRQITYYNGSKTGHAWILSWDGAENASEFEDALESYLTKRGSRVGDAWRDGNTRFRYERLDDDTVVLLAGDPGFVETTIAEKSDDTVRLDTE